MAFYLTWFLYLNTYEEEKSSFQNFTSVSVTYLRRKEFLKHLTEKAAMKHLLTKYLGNFVNTVTPFRHKSRFYQVKMKVYKKCIRLMRNKEIITKG